jgi:hypothetical protein
MKNIDPELTDSVKTMGAGKWQLLRLLIRITAGSSYPSPWRADLPKQLIMCAADKLEIVRPC